MQYPVLTGCFPGGPGFIYSLNFKEGVLRYLLTAATDMEMKQLWDSYAGEERLDFLVTGLGPVETTLSVSSYLARSETNFAGVINFGVAGAYLGLGIDLLDLCLARSEVLGDLGICLDREILGFDSKKLPVISEFVLDDSLLQQAEKILAAGGLSWRTGGFVTVNCASGTAERGTYLRDRHRAVCENMEGAAVARVCEEFGLPCLELRCISNLVEERNPANWRLKEACRKGAEAVAVLLQGLLGSRA